MSCVWWRQDQLRGHIVAHWQTFNWEPCQISAVKAWDAHRLQKGPDLPDANDDPQFKAAWQRPIQYATDSQHITNTVYVCANIAVNTHSLQCLYVLSYPPSFMLFESMDRSVDADWNQTNASHIFFFFCILHILIAGITLYTQSGYLI